MYRAVLSIFFCVALCGLVFAEKRVALVIGNSDYANVPRLPNPVKDAGAIADALARPGFDVTHIDNVSVAGMRKALAAFENKTNGADWALVYYAGHGMEMDGKNWLVPIDATLGKASDVADEAIQLDRVLERVHSANLLRIVILDACRNNPFLARIIMGQGQTRSIARGLAPIQPHPGEVVFYAARDGHVALDGHGAHSPFAQALLNALNKPGLELGLFFREVTSDVLEATAPEVQEPFVYGSLPRQQYYFTAPALVVPKLLEPEKRTEPQIAVVAPPKPMRDACDGILVPVALSPKKSCIRPGSGQSFKDCPNCPEMVVVPSGSFMMGSSENDSEHQSNEGPQHQVTISEPFAVGKYAVTFAEWDACVTGGGCGGYRPKDQGWGRDDRPVINVNWNDTKAYVSWLSARTGKIYRLLSEAEFEYAARSGATTPFWWGTSATTDQANYNGNEAGSREKVEFRQKTMRVFSFQPNAWGLYQVHGNVWTWAQDCWVDNYYNAPIDGSANAANDCSRRVLRGGSWNFGPAFSRATSRYWYTSDSRYPNFGFRLARTLHP
ncbi:MAG: SUMF1/EgtB/PvdO family nonheme iron enzyme [Rhodomicrobium sp.]